MARSNLPPGTGQNDLPGNDWPELPDFRSVFGAFCQAMQQEHLNAREDNFEPFHSSHEGLAVLWEEFEELKALVFMSRADKAEMTEAHYRREYILECIQIATMSFCMVDECIKAGQMEITAYNVPDGPPADYFPPDRYPLM